MLRKPGYYWVWFPRDPEGTIGAYNGESSYPWRVVDSDEIFEEWDLETIGPYIGPLAPKKEDIIS